MTWWIDVSKGGCLSSTKLCAQELGDGDGDVCTAVLLAAMGVGLLPK